MVYYIQRQHTLSHTHTHTHTHTHAHTHTHVRTITPEIGKCNKADCIYRQHTHTHTYTHAYTQTYTHIYTHIHTYTWDWQIKHGRLYSQAAYAHMHTCTHTHTHTYTHTYTYTYTHLHLILASKTWQIVFTGSTHTHTHIHTHTHTHTHTHMPTYTHLHLILASKTWQMVFTGSTFAVCGYLWCIIVCSWMSHGMLLLSLLKRTFYGPKIFGVPVMWYSMFVNVSWHATIVSVEENILWSQDFWCTCDVI